LPQAPNSLLAPVVTRRAGAVASLSRDDPARALVVAGAAAGLSLVVGWLIASGHTVVALVLCAALPALLVAAWAGLAAIAGLLLIITLNGVPGIDLTRFNVHGSFETLDICAIALIVLAASRHFLGVRTAADRNTRRLAAWSCAFLAVWAIAFVKGINDGVPMLKAALFGRDFLFFALLVPFAKALVKTDRELERFVLAVAAMTTIFAVGEIGATVGALPPGVINDIQVLPVGPFQRVYSNMNDLVVLGFCCALAYALLRNGRGARLAAAVAAVCGVAVVLQLTRAIYVGLAFGMLLAFVVWAAGRFPDRLRLRRRILWIGGGIVVAVFIAAFLAPQVVSSSSVQALTHRISEGASDVGSARRGSGTSANTLAYREQVSSTMLEVLGSRWVLGLGFLHPAYVHFPQLPHGSIRSNDTGLFNGLMTMGVVGTVLIYVPALIVLGGVLLKTSEKDRWNWLRLGGMIWLLSVIAGSLTLATWFSTNGLVLTSIVIGVLVGDAQRRSRSDGRRRA
jgi:O-Antigen ligase